LELGVALGKAIVPLAEVGGSKPLGSTLALTVPFDGIPTGLVGATTKMQGSIDPGWLRYQ
jgi:hypothetical protein